MEGLEPHLNEIKSLFMEDLIEEAHEKLIQLEQQHSHNPSILEFIHSHEEIRIIKDDMQDIQTCLQFIDDTTNWQLVSDSKGVRTHIRRGKGTQFIGRAEMQMDAHVFPFLSLFSETDLYSSWIKMMKNCQEIGNPTLFRRMIRYEVSMPWPIHTREVVLRGLGFPVRSRKSALVVVKSIETESFLGIDIPRNPDMVRFRVHNACIEVKYLGPSSTKITILMWADSYLRLIPNWLLKWFAKKIVGIFMDSVRKEVSKFEGSEYENRVRTKAHYYDKIYERLLSTL